MAVAYMCGISLFFLIVKIGSEIIWLPGFMSETAERTHTQRSRDTLYNWLWGKAAEGKEQRQSVGGSNSLEFSKWSSSTDVPYGRTLDIEALQM